MKCICSCHQNLQRTSWPHVRSIKMASNCPRCLGKNIFSDHLWHLHKRQRDKMVWLLVQLLVLVARAIYRCAIALQLGGMASRLCQKPPPTTLLPVGNKFSFLVLRLRSPSRKTRCYREEPKFVKSSVKWPEFQPLRHGFERLDTLPEPYTSWPVHISSNIVYFAFFCPLKDFLLCTHWNGSPLQLPPNSPVLFNYVKVPPIEVVSNRAACDSMQSCGEDFHTCCYSLLSTNIRLEAE